MLPRVALCAASQCCPTHDRPLKSCPVPATQSSTTAAADVPIASSAAALTALDMLIKAVYTANTSGASAQTFWQMAKASWSSNLSLAKWRQT